MKSKAEAKLRRKHGGFMIGDLVLVEEFYYREKKNSKAEYHRAPYPCRFSTVKAEPRAGWIVGFTSLRPGKVEWIGPDEGWSYEATGSVEAVLVRFWPHLKPVPVPYDGFREWREGDPEPYPPNGSPKEVEESKWCYEQNVKDGWITRDDKGRFLS